MRMMIRQGPYSTYVLESTIIGKEILLQSDYDYPILARDFGLIPCCNQIDGTVDCEHKTVAEHIADGVEYIDRCAWDGKWVEDPGYFTMEDN